MVEPKVPGAAGRGEHHRSYGVTRNLPSTVRFQLWGVLTRRVLHCDSRGPSPLVGHAGGGEVVGVTTTAPAPEHGTSRPNRSRWLVLLPLFVVMGFGAAITVVVTGDDDPASAAQLSEVKASCGDWMNSSQAEDQADDQWCTDMFAWMSDQSAGSMMGSMMWQGAEQMGTTCREWVAQDRADLGASGQQRCADMIEWMNGHMSSRDGRWMMGSG